MAEHACSVIGNLLSRDGIERIIDSTVGQEVLNKFGRTGEALSSRERVSGEQPAKIGSISSKRISPKLLIAKS
jgi:hypothetical protein